MSPSPKLILSSSLSLVNIIIKLTFDTDTDNPDRLNQISITYLQHFESLLFKFFGNNGHFWGLDIDFFHRYFKGIFKFLFL